MAHPYTDELGKPALQSHLALAHRVPWHEMVTPNPVDQPTLAALNARHRLEHDWPHIAPGLAPRPQDVDPMSEAEYRALWGDR